MTESKTKLMHLFNHHLKWS